VSRPLGVKLTPAATPTDRQRFFFAGVYLLVVFGAVVSTATGEKLPLLAWPLLLLLPASAFTPAVTDGFRLHRTADPAAMTSLWRRCLLYIWGRTRSAATGRR
jgi:hypothetical protein